MTTQLYLAAALTALQDCSHCYLAARCVKWLHGEFSICSAPLIKLLAFIRHPHTICSSGVSVKENVLVLCVGNLISTLQPPHCFPHVLGLKWWCVSPLLTNIQSCKGKDTSWNYNSYNLVVWVTSVFLNPPTNLPRQFPQQRPLQYQTWQ